MPFKTLQGRGHAIKAPRLRLWPLLHGHDPAGFKRQLRTRRYPFIPLLMQPSLRMPQRTSATCKTKLKIAHMLCTTPDKQTNKC